MLDTDAATRPVSPIPASQLSSPASPSAGRSRDSIPAKRPRMKSNLSDVTGQREEIDSLLPSSGIDLTDPFVCSQGSESIKCEFEPCDSSEITKPNSTLGRHDTLKRRRSVIQATISADDMPSLPSRHKAPPSRDEHHHTRKHHSHFRLHRKRWEKLIWRPNGLATAATTSTGAPASSLPLTVTLLSEEPLKTYLDGVRSLIAFQAFGGARDDLGSAENGLVLANMAATTQHAYDTLHRCNYSLPAALDTITRTPVPDTDTPDHWTAEEVRLFALGLRKHGKDFHAIQRDFFRGHLPPDCRMPNILAGRGTGIACVAKNGFLDGSTSHESAHPFNYSQQQNNTQQSNEEEIKQSIGEITVEVGPITNGMLRGVSASRRGRRRTSTQPAPGGRICNETTDTVIVVAAISDGIPSETPKIEESCENLQWMKKEPEADLSSVVDNCLDSIGSTGGRRGTDEVHQEEEEDDDEEEDEEVKTAKTVTARLSDSGIVAESVTATGGKIKSFTGDSDSSLPKCPPDPLKTVKQLVAFYYYWKRKSNSISPSTAASALLMPPAVSSNMECSNGHTSQHVDFGSGLHSLGFQAALSVGPGAGTTLGTPSAIVTGHYNKNGNVTGICAASGGNGVLAGGSSYPATSISSTTAFAASSCSGPLGQHSSTGHNTGKRRGKSASSSCAAGAAGQARVANCEFSILGWLLSDLEIILISCF
ncbi:unnamed protein product [Protopolystoma xenopodis]|uniref:ELM2 domain-containing protein n=1 Tax=Protopolystoma xenopodis TaxID=117903 RepID=A0A448WFV7_9PLAT|nr:unnamed protein product [Protopolystoma xenopodis]